MEYIDKIRIGSNYYEIIDNEARSEIEYIKQNGAGNSDSIKDKDYDPNNNSGLGRKTLKLKNGNNILTQEDFDKDHTMYIIQYDFDLNGENINVPEGCILDFQGGSIVNGSLSGETEILHKPLDLYEKVDCMELYVLNETHLQVSDVQDVIDSYASDYVYATESLDQLISTSHYYSIDGLDKLIFRMPLHVLDNVQYGSTYPDNPWIRYMFYDREFKYIGTTPDWLIKHNRADGFGVTGIYTDIPEGAAYVNVLMSVNAYLARPLVDPYVLNHMYFNFLDNSKIYISEEFKNIPDIYWINMERHTNTEIVYPNDTSKKPYFRINNNYNLGSDLRRGSYFIPRSVLKNYKFIRLVGHGPGSTFSITTDGVTEERYRHPMLIYFLKKTPKITEEEVEFSDWYPNRISVNQAETTNFLIPPDCDCIFIYRAYSWNDGTGTKMWNASPKWIGLYKEDAMNLNTMKDDIETYSERNVNAPELRFIHWNIGADNIGGYLNYDYLTDELLEKRRDGFLQFFNKVARTHNILFNEYSYWNSPDKRINYDSLPPATIYYGKKTLPRFNQQSLAIWYKNNLIESTYGWFDCCKGLTTTSSEKRPIYSFGYVIYHYALGGSNLNVMHTHLPTPMDVNTKKAIYSEMKSIMDKYANSIIVGDFNDAGTYNPITKQGDRYRYIEDVFNTSESGWHIANKEFGITENPDIDPELAGTPTHDYGRNYWGGDEIGIKTENVLDFCLWKGSYMSMTKFKVRTDAIINNSGYTEDQEGVEDVNGSLKGNEAYCNRRLSDHWPIEFVVRGTDYNIVPDTEGNVRYNQNNKSLEWNNGTKWLTASKVNLNTLPINCDINTLLEEDTYSIDSGEISKTMTGLPKSLDFSVSGWAAAFVLIVRRMFKGSSGLTRAILILISNMEGIIFIRRSKLYSIGNESYEWEPWYQIKTTEDDTKHIGSFSERPTLRNRAVNNPDCGFMYICTDNSTEKPIWWTGQKWIDASGNTVTS